MTKEYKIMSIESYETDSSGFIHVEFRIKGDSRKTVRIIESSDYVEWVESLENNRGLVLKVGRKIIMMIIIHQSMVLILMFGKMKMKMRDILKNISTKIIT